MIVGSAESTPESLQLGLPCQYLVTDASCTLGVKWDDIPIPSTDICCDIITAAGDLIVGTAPSTATALPVPGLEGYSLISNPACAEGMEWKPSVYYGNPGTGAILSYNYNGEPSWKNPAGQPGQILSSTTPSTTFPEGLKWCVPNYICCSVFTKIPLCERGQLITTDCNGNPISMLRGTENQYLASKKQNILNPVENLLEWRTPDWVSENCFDRKGDLLVGTGNNTFTALQVPGASTTICDNCILVSSSSSTCGMNWVDPTGLAIPPSSFTGKGALLVGTAAGTYCSLPAPAQNNSVLVSCPSAPSGVIWAAPAQQYLCGIIWCSYDIFDGTTCRNCDWLCGPGGACNIPFGLWQVNITGNFTEGRAGCSYGSFCVTWWDQAGCIAAGPRVCYAIDGVTIPYSYSVIANNSYCCCGLYFNWSVDNARTRTENIAASFTALYLGPS